MERRACSRTNRLQCVCIGVRLFIMHEVVSDLTLMCCIYTTMAMPAARLCASNVWRGIALALIDEQNVRLRWCAVEFDASIRVRCSMRSSSHPNNVLFKYIIMAMLALRLLCSLNARHGVTFTLDEQNVCFYWCAEWCTVQMHYNDDDACVFTVCLGCMFVLVVCCWNATCIRVPCGMRL